MTFFIELEKNNPKIHMVIHNTSYSQNILEQNINAGIVLDFKIYCTNIITKTM
jgi:hypothetical protein